MRRRIDFMSRGIALPGGHQGEYEKPVDTVKKAGIDALVVNGFEITQNDRLYVEGHRPRTWGFFCTPGGEGAGIWLEETSPSHTLARISSEKSSFGQACQKEWTSPILNEMDKTLMVNSIDMSSKNTLRAQIGYRLAALTMLTLTSCSSHSTYTMLVPHHDSKPGDCNVAVYQTGLPSRDFVRISRIDVHIERSYYVRSTLQDALPELKRKACESGADAVIEVQERGANINLSETNLYHVTAMADHQDPQGKSDLSGYLGM